MSSLMLINPAHRPKRRRSAAQKAATARMVAARRRRHNPIAKRRATRRVKRRAHNPIHTAHVLHHRARRRAARRHNPIRSDMGGMLGSVAYGVAGSIGVNLVFNALDPYLPAKMTQGNMSYVSQAGLAVAMGILGKKVLGSHAAKMVEGALIVLASNAITDMSIASGSTMLGAIPSYAGSSSYAPGASIFGAITEESSGGFHRPNDPQALYTSMGAIPDYV